MNDIVSNSNKKVDSLEKELRSSQEKCEHLEAQSRRENLTIYGMDERANETWEDTEAKVREYIGEDLELDETRISI